jgi:hypothetical protein
MGRPGHSETAVIHLAPFFLSAVFTAAPAAPTLPLPAEEPVVLAYRFVEGQPAVFDLTQEMTSTQTAFGETTVVRTRTGNRTRTELVERQDDGSLLIANTIESVRFWAKDEAEEVSFDSENPEDEAKAADAAVASVALMKGVRVVLHLGPDGTVRAVPNADELLAKAGAMEDAMMAEIARQLWTPEAITAMYEGNLKVLPGVPVRPGDTWTHTVELPFDLGVIVMTMNMTLKGLQEDAGRSVADIGITGTITSRFGANSDFMMKLDDSRLDGEVRFDIADGVIDRFRLDSVFTLNVFVPDQPEVFASVKFDQKVNQVRVKE